MATELSSLQFEVKEYATKQSELRKKLEEEIRIKNAEHLTSLEEELQKQITENVSKLRDKDESIASLEAELGSLKEKYGVS